jgi:hypothetical protein
MKDLRKTNVIKTKSLHKYSASSFWSSSDFDTDFKIGSNLDFTKLAATQRAIGNFVNIVTGKQIPVVFQDNDSSYTDGERVVIGSKLEDDNFDPAVGLALHEGSHIAYTDFSLFKNASSLSKSKFSTYITTYITNKTGNTKEISESEYGIIKDLLNWIEDRRIDYKVYTIAPGYRMYYEAMYDKYFNDKVIDKALQRGEKCIESWDDYIFHIINFTNSNRKLNTLPLLQQVWDLIDLKNIHRLQQTTDALDVAIDVYLLLEPSCNANKNKEVEDFFNQNGFGNIDPSDMQSENSNNPSDIQSENDFNLDDQDSEADADDQNDMPKLSDNDIKKLEKIIQKQRDFINGVQKKQGRLTKQQSALVNVMRESGTETRIVDTGMYSTISADVTTIVIKKLNNAVICTMPELFKPGAANVINNEYIHSSKMHYIDELQQNVMHGIILGKQLGNKLQLRNSERTLKTTRLNTGKIDRRLIAQLGYDNVNVFHRIVTDRFKNYFIHISIDASGSMSGDRLNNAIKSAVAIAQAASMTTGIRVQISLRGTQNLQGKTERCITLYAYDSAHDKISKIKNIFKYLHIFGCTPEGIAFKSIEKDIKADAKGDELIFINYSDGAPSRIHGAASSYDGVKFTKKVVNEMKSNGINVISYFIYSQCSYSSYYSDQDRKAFKTMYGEDAEFINPVNMIEISKTINNKFLEIIK